MPPSAAPLPNRTPDFVPCPVAFGQPPSQYKTFKFETPEAVEARKSVKKLESEVKTQDKKIKVSGVRMIGGGHWTETAAGVVEVLLYFGVRRCKIDRI